MARLLLVVLASLVSAVLVRAAAPPPALYETRKIHDPDGIGKFYMGREIAHVMGYEGAGWLERPERQKEENTARLLRSLPVKPGMVIADVGAGSGYFTFPLAKQVGPKGKVYAVDVQQEMLDIIAKRKKAGGVANVEGVKGTITDPKLPADSVDLILMVDVYHEFSHPYEMTRQMVKSLKVGGVIAFVEYRLEDPNVPIKLVHKMSQKQVIREMKPFALKHVKTIDTLPWQHIILFEKIATP